MTVCVGGGGRVIGESGHAAFAVRVAMTRVPSVRQGPIGRPSERAVCMACPRGVSAPLPPPAPRPCASEPRAGEPLAEEPRAACHACRSVWCPRGGRPCGFASATMHNTRSTSRRGPIPPGMPLARRRWGGGESSMCRPALCGGGAGGGEDGVREEEAPPGARLVPGIGCL